MRGLSKVTWIGLGVFAAQLAWVIYNTYVPIFLQAGAADFDTHNSVHVFGFGLSATWTGIIMTLDNVAAFFIQPLMGPLSDRTHTRWGRRIPYLAVFIPIAALGLAIIPLAPLQIPAILNGQAHFLTGLLGLFIVSLLVMLGAMAIWRTPIFALMADITPSSHRSHANGILNLMAGIGGVLAFILGSVLYKAYPALPFWAAALCMLAALALLLWKVREPSRSEGTDLLSLEDHSKIISPFRLIASFRRLPTEHIRPLLWLAVVVFFYMLGFHPIEAFFSSYGVHVLGLSEGDTGLVLASAYITFIVFAVPSGMLAARIGRRRTMQAGLALFAAVMLVAYFTPITEVMVILLGIGGIAWALIDINGLPMILDITRSNAQNGIYTGVYFAATTLAAIMGPVLNGLLIDLTGRNYSMIFIIGPVFFGLSFIALRRVQGGEAHM